MKKEEQASLLLYRPKFSKALGRKGKGRTSFREHGI